MAILTAIAISIGGLIEIVPMFSAKLGPEHLAGVTPLSPLEAAGRDIYIREGCCHLPLADDPAHPGRDAALWRVDPGR